MVVLEVMLPKMCSKGNNEVVDASIGGDCYLKCAQWFIMKYNASIGGDVT